MGILAFMYIIAQMIGAMLAQVVVWLQYLPHWDMTPDPETKLSSILNSTRCCVIQHQTSLVKLLVQQFHSDWCNGNGTK